LVLHLLQELACWLQHWFLLYVGQQPTGYTKLNCLPKLVALAGCKVNKQQQLRAERTIANTASVPAASVLTNKQPTASPTSKPTPSADGCAISQPHSQLHNQRPPQPQSQ
jgi:hypothetical protein